ncbi:MAG: hypothetical protein GC180_09305 [Bacteroidetes bacterium]|nr:hypothetical protein [Bacteroidota bacterium]
MKKLIKKLFRLWALLTLSSRKRFANADVVIWKPNRGWRYWFSDTAVNDFAWEKALVEMDIPYTVFKGEDIGRLKNCTIIMSYDRGYLNRQKFANYSKNLCFIIEQLKEQGNKVIPELNEALFWENKTHMSNEFRRLNISTPQTQSFHTIEEIDLEALEYPCLLKEVHSASAKGVHKVNNKEELLSLLNDDYLKRNDAILIQELLNMRRDLRVILTGNEIVHHYWRINLADEWKPTSTGHGSKVDFVSFPENWRAFILQEFRKLKMVTGAFDIAWQNDDLSTKPLILEVSPNYQLNPVVSKDKYLTHYGEYKKSLELNKNSYDYQYILQTFRLYPKIAEFYFGDFSG